MLSGTVMAQHFWVRMRFVAVLIAALSLFLSFGNAMADDKQLPPPEIKKTFKIYREPDGDLVQKRLYVEFIGSPKLSAIFREELSARGFTLVSTADAADIQLRFQGTVAMGLFATKSKTVPLAEAFEKLTPVATGKEAAETSNRSLLGVATMDAVAKGLAPSLRTAFSATNLLEWLGDITGLHDGFNKVLTGDPRGFCMSEHCNKYQQQVLVGVSGGGTWLVTLSTLNEQVVLDQMIRDALVLALSPLAGSGGGVSGR